MCYEKGAAPAVSMQREMPQPPSYGVAPPAFRLADATHVGTVHLQVSDVGRSLAYYEQVLGLRVLTATKDRVTLGPHAEERVLVTLQSGSGVVPARQGAFGLYHFAILLPDRAALGKFATHLSALGVRVGMADHLVSEALYLWDPDGLGIEVYADRPRHTWRRHGRELAMTTDPMDITGVIAAAAGARWGGAPPGTTIGHVHLSVGSLDAAEAFFHRALGLDKTVWTYPGALFLSAGGYHHHLGTNIWSRGPAPSANQARLLEWDLVVPSYEEVAAVERSLRAAGHVPERTSAGVTAVDPWGVRIGIRAEEQEDVA